MAVSDIPAHLEVVGGDVATLDVESVVESVHSAVAPDVSLAQ